MLATKLVAVPTRQKRAEDMPESTYESSLSTLARNVLQDKAPRLFDYEIGFQLLERSDDGDRSVGVFGFKIGPEQLFAPVVFNKGAVKATELLWVRSLDQFVPLVEGWVDAFMRKKPTPLGQSITKTESRKGVGYPDLMPLVRSPFKMAAFEKFDLIKMAERDPSFNRTLRRWLDEYPSFKVAFGMYYDANSLPPLPASPAPAASPVLAGGGVERPLTPLATPAPSGYRLAPSLATAMPKPVTGPLGGSVLDKAQQAHNGVDNQQAALAKQAAGKGGNEDHGVRVDTKTTMIGRIVKYDDSTVQEVMTNDYKSDDKRKETSMVVPTSVTTCLTNPQESGRYEVLRPDGKFAELLVVMSGIDQPRQRCILFDVSDGGKVKAYGEAEPQKVWVQPLRSTGAVEDQVTTMAAAIKGFPSPTRLKPSWTAKYMLVGPDGQGVGPFRVRTDMTGDGDQTTFEIDSCYCDDLGGFGPMSGIDNDMLWYRDGANEYWGYGTRHDRNPSRRRSTDTVVLTGKPGHRLVRDGNAYLVPDTFKLLTLQEDKDTDSDPRPSRHDDDKNTLALGRPEDFLAEVQSKTAALEVDHQFGLYRVDKVAGLGRGDAVRELMCGWDLSEADSLDLLKQADKGSVRVRVFPTERVLDWAVKLADNVGRHPATGMTDDASAPDFPEIPGFQVPTLNGSVDGNSPYETQIPVDPSMLASGRTNNDMYAPPENSLIGQAVEAARSGQKEVFDTGSFSSHVRRQSDDAMIDDQLPPLMESMDAYGTLIFNLAYHEDAFEDRYGKSDLSELEGLLRSAFKTTGETLLFLKQKSVRSFPGDYGIDFAQKSLT